MDSNQAKNHTDMRNPSPATLRYRHDQAVQDAARRGPPPPTEWPTGSQAVVTDDFGNEWNTITKSQPWRACGHTLILIEGIYGGYDLERVKIRPWDPTLRHFGERGGPAAVLPPRVTP